MALNMHQRNAQAVKVILSEMYIRWASGEKSIQQIESLIDEMLVASQQKGPTNGAYLIGGSSVAVPATKPSRTASQTQAGPLAPPPQRYTDPQKNSVSSGGSITDGASGGNSGSGGASTSSSSSSTAIAAAGATNKTNTGSASTSDRRAVSPPPSPPTRQVAKKFMVEDTRTPSPVQAGRLYSVDELDHPHRASSPGGAAISTGVTMHTKPVAVDPMAPLPHGSSGSHSPSNASGPASQMVSSAQGGGSNSSGSSSSHSSGSSVGADSHSSSATGVGSGSGMASLDNFLDTPMAIVDQYGAADSLAPSLSARFVSSSGSFATRPSSSVPVATLEDIPVFYNRHIAKGGRKGLGPPSDEEEALRAYFASKSAASAAGGMAKGRGSGGTAGIDTLKRVRKPQFEKLCREVFNVPVWMKDHLYNRIFAASNSPENGLSYDDISKYYYKKMAPLSVNRRYFELIAQDPQATYLVQEDFKIVFQHLVDNHPGLEFLKQPEFQEYYCRTVAIRIMYCLEHQQSGRLSWPDFDRSDLPQVMRKLDETPDINVVLQYFSYEHFYVLYCRFWDLDTDRDQHISFDDLCNYGSGVITSVLKRVVDGEGRKNMSERPGMMGFEDFVYFCLSEEDKNSDPAVLYWFKVLDTDGDGVLCGYELGQFYEENRQQFLLYTDMDDAELRYDDMMCQMQDMLGKPIVKNKSLGVSLAELRACPTPSHFFDMIFNATKFMAFEHRDPFMEHQQKGWPERNDWDRFARAEYDRLASEAK